MPHFRVYAAEEDSKGIVPRVSDHIFTRITQDTSANEGLDFEVHVSYIEIYMERIRDLLRYGP